MKLIHSFTAAVIVIALVGPSTAQEVFYPGNGVSLPVVTKEVHPSADGPAIVVLDCIVRPNGAVSDIEVVSSADASLTQAATDALSQWQFKPGIKEGKPVSVRITVEMSFTPRR